MNIETYSEPFQTSMMDFFCKNSQLLKAVNCFHQKKSSHVFDRALNMTTKGLIESFITSFETFQNET